MREFHVEHAILHVEAATEGVDPLTKEPVIRYPGTFTMEGVMNGTYKPASEVENPLFWRLSEEYGVCRDLWLPVASRHGRHGPFRTRTAYPASLACLCTRESEAEAFRP